MKVLYVVRGNEVKLTIPGPSVKIKNGNIWVEGNPLFGINDPAEKVRIAGAIRAGKWDEIPADAYTHIGDNPNGLWAGDEIDFENHPANALKKQKAMEKAEEDKKQKTIYLSSRGWGDFSPVEWRGDITRAENEILAECKSLLKKGYDVDHPNQADGDLLQKIRVVKKEYENPKPEHKPIEHGPGYCYSCKTYCYGDCGDYQPKMTNKIMKQEVDGINREQNYGIND